MKIYKVVTRINDEKIVLDATTSEEIAVKLALKYRGVNVDTCEVPFVDFIVTAIFGKWFALTY